MEEDGIIKEGVNHDLKKHNSCQHSKLSAIHGEWPTASLKGVEDKSYFTAYVVNMRKQNMFS